MSHAITISEQSRQLTEVRARQQGLGNPWRSCFQRHINAILQEFEPVGGNPVGGGGGGGGGATKREGEAWAQSHMPNEAQKPACML
jgi:hypothetical protein